MSAREDLDACTARRYCPADVHLSDCPRNAESVTTVDLLGQLQGAVDRARAGRQSPATPVQRTPDVAALLSQHAEYEWWPTTREFICTCETSLGTGYPDAAHHAHVAAVLSDAFAEMKAAAVRTLLDAVETEWFNGNLAGDVADRIRAAAQVVTTDV